MEAHRPASQKVSLAGVLNPDENRDSAYFSSTDASSKHTSAASCMGVHMLSPTGSVHHSSPTNKTPSPIPNSLLPHALVSPTQTNMSVASMVSPISAANANGRHYNRPTSFESGGSNTTLEAHPHMAPRRESVDSRMNQGFSDMRLGNSPYASHNHSTASIQNTLNQQRNPRAAALEHVAIHRISNGYQPSAEREPLSKMSRTAPAITGPATSHIARAAEPTKGQAWAFPDGDEISGARQGPPPSILESRRSSITESIASSQFTTESRLPPGQQRLDEQIDFNRLSSVSNDFPPVHHHSLQHKQLDDLRDDASAARLGAQPYSRTPELRKSHKLAERKRRTEMKELFDQLRDLMPQERGSKASKWEILTKAITEHERMANAVRHIQSQNASLAQDNDSLRRENHALMLQLRGGAPPSQHAPPVAAPPPPPTSVYPPSDPYTHRPELPPLRALNGGAPDNMTGVQYDAPRTNGYRPADRY